MLPKFICLTSSRIAFDLSNIRVHLPTYLANPPCRVEFDKEWQDCKAISNGNQSNFVYHNPCFEEGVTKYSLQQIDVDDRNEDAGFPSTFWIQYSALTQRYFTTSKRRILSPMHMTLTLIETIVASAVGFQIQLDDTTVQDLLSLVRVPKISLSRCLKHVYFIPSIFFIADFRISLYMEL